MTAPPARDPVASAPQRLRIEIAGAVQGMGFRPFVCRLARELGLAGWVANSRRGVVIEAEGARHALETLLGRLSGESPAQARIAAVCTTPLEPTGASGFAIRANECAGAQTAIAPADGAVCARCVADLFDPTNRRFRYPFTHCAACGPRYSIIRALPFARDNTVMREFPLCRDCLREFQDPEDRRFHAELIACPACGPKVALLDNAGNLLAHDDDAIAAAARALAAGVAVAVKGLGGFQILVDARNQAAVEQLRRAKHRDAKPFALMFPCLDAVAEECIVSGAEETLLRSYQAPIVLLRRVGRAGSPIAPAVAPAHPNLGVMLPYTPLHHLLMAEAGFPVVATSGNRRGEPICISEQEAFAKLTGVAALFLVHNRPILRPVDDSVARVVAGGVQILRRARGYAPLPVADWKRTAPRAPLAAVGAHQKNTVAFMVGGSICLSQHIGDLDSADAYAVFEDTVAAIPTWSGAVPQALACDAHPGYASSEFARRSGRPVLRVQHHHAHVLSCAAEHGLAGPLLGVAWDGTGDGLDGTIWGGEWLQVDGARFQRVAHLRYFPLPGGERAIREPRRAALGALFEAWGERALAAEDLAPLQSLPAAQRASLRAMLGRGFHCPRTSSAGRLFDAFAALLGLRQVAGFEAQAACDLEFAARAAPPQPAYPFLVHPPAGAGQPAILDWAPMLNRVVEDIRAATPVGVISARVHASFVAMLVEAAGYAGQRRVVLTGGCFQNQLLTEMALHQLRERGYEVYAHRAVPPNDGGIAVGQLVAALLTQGAVAEDVSGGPR